MDLVISYYPIIAAVAILQAAVMLVPTYEHARFARRRLRVRRETGFRPRVELVVPCKGVEPGLDSLVKVLREQNYPAYRVTFVVESTKDPAWQYLQRLLAHPGAVETRVLNAGHAQQCGQKVHNLLVATAALDPAVEVIAFLDCDILLTPHWLGDLVQPLRKSKVGAVTGYRWFIPNGKDWPSDLLSALNAPIAVTLGKHPWNAIWGGTWAIRRSTFETASIRRAWKGALTEDYPAWKAIRNAGLRIIFEPSCLQASPIRSTWSGLLEFARRQYLITRIYAPAYWWLEASGELLFNVVFWGGLALEAWNWSSRGELTGITIVLLILYCLAALRAWIRQSVALLKFPTYRNELLRSRRLDIWAQPLLALCNFGLILSSAFGRRVSWRGIRYQMDSRHQTRILT